MGLAYNVYLNSTKIYGCKNCKAHLSNHEDIISRVRPLAILAAAIHSHNYSRIRADRLPLITELSRSAWQGLPLPERGELYCGRTE
jgi:hypothetical protein